MIIFKMRVEKLFALLFVSIFCIYGEAIAQVASSAIPFKQPPPPSEWGMTRVGAALALCVLGAGVGYYLIRNRKGLVRLVPKKEKTVRVLESQRLGTGAVLHVVEFAGKRHLLAQSAQGISRIASAAATTTPSTETESE